MQLNSISNIAISALGNPSSLIPLAIKDTINSTGITYFSYEAGGNLEGKDRFIDEFGTQAIWLFGLPGFKALADKTLYKLKGFNPDVDVRVVNSKEHIEFARKVMSNSDANSKALLEDIEKAASKYPAFKKLFYSKFILATGLTFASYFALTKYKHKSTEKAVTKQYMQKKANEQFLAQKTQEEKVFDDFHSAFKGSAKKQDKNVAFKGLQSFMFDPVKNLMLVDAGITTERLTKSRTKSEFTEYAIKEGSLLFFMYLAGSWIQNGIEKLAKSFCSAPVDMNLRFLNSDELKKAVKENKITADLEAFNKLKTNKEILDYIIENPKSIIVQGAKKSGIIKLMKKSDKIDAGSYINVEDLKDLTKKLDDFMKPVFNQGVNIDKYMKKARNYKIGAILTNIGVCCAALGYVMPKLMFKYREKQTGTKDFHVAKEVEARLAQSFSGDKI